MRFKRTRTGLFIGIVCAFIASVIVGRGDGLYVPAPSWVYSIFSLGTGVATALGINVGSSGAVLVKGTSVCADLSNGATGCSTAYTTPAYTPAISGATTPGTGQTYSIQVGSAEQFGRQVIARFTIVLTSSGTAAGNLQVSLPVAAASTTNDYGDCFISQYTLSSNAALNYGLVGSIAPGASVAVILTNGSISQTNVSVAQGGNSLLLVGLCNYRAS